MSTQEIQVQAPTPTSYMGQIGGANNINELAATLMDFVDSSCSERSQRAKCSKSITKGSPKRKPRSPSTSAGTVVTTASSSTATSARHKSAIHRIRKRDAFKRIDCKLLENDDRIRKLEEEIDNVLARFST